jgi:hypothetical protein
MIWLLIVAVVWYWWRLYSLSFNPTQFPDPQYAQRVWDRRSNRSLLLGAAIITSLFYMLGITQKWWVLVLCFLGSALTLAFIQPLFVGLIIGLRAKVMLNRMMKEGEVLSPKLAPYAWTYYLTKEEKMNALDETKAKEFKS